MMKDCILKNYSINDNTNKEVYPVKYLCFEKKNNVLKNYMLKGFRAV